MKVTKTIEVEVCVTCGREQAFQIKPCVSCGVEICSNCTTRFNVSVELITPSHTSAQYTSWSTKRLRDHEFVGVFCEKCANEIDIKLRNAGLVKTDAPSNNVIPC